ncbi:siderophore-interacting protein [Vandammella animalimorsus]|uniref:Phage tail protein n=1 Tax=Vandammella animalimorsus TaxID=2029117 RepID=A0A2A2AH66_9BURK|nr:siderophore-interacting protein [Vandammella animalimorsus]PAT37062.1 phage tail protein [Vandammella animalimorsus]
MKTAFQTDTPASARTPLADQDHKLDILEHINDEHPEEVLAIAQAYGAADARSARLEDIFQEGCLLAVTCAETANGSSANGATDSAAARPLFVPFALKGDLEENVLYLAYEALARQGKPLSGQHKQFFSVLGSEMLTPHMLRLHLQSTVPLPEDAPGHAWFFSLKTLERLPAKLPAARQRMSLIGQWFSRLLLWWLKRASPARREQVMLSFTKDQRYYTLRRARKSSADAPFADLAEVDVFLHRSADGAPTPGSRWASALRAGDVIFSQAQYHEHTEHLAQGQCVLIGDETALPTVAALLEDWRNPQPPVVFCITADALDQPYLADASLPAGARLHRISASGDVAAAVIAELERLPAIDAVWGALENNDAKAIRQHLRHARGLAGSRNRVKGYWRRSGNATG